MTECGRRNEMVFGEQSDDVRGREGGSKGRSPTDTTPSSHILHLLRKYREARPYLHCSYSFSVLDYCFERMNHSKGSYMLLFRRAL